MRIVNAEVDAMKDEILSTYNYLHSIPEVGWEEFKTSAYIEKFMADHGFEPCQRFETGLAYMIDSGVPGPTVGYRADIDALGYMQDGVKIAMHSCGHDAHATMLMYTAVLMKDLVTRGRLKIIFQPNEENETRSGAKELIKAGFVDDVDKLIAMHLRPIAEARSGQVICSLVHGALRAFKVEIQGEASHGGRPHLGKNPIDAAVALITGVNAIKMDTAFHCTAKATGIQAGGGDMTSVPDHCSVTLDLRARTNAAMELLYAKVMDVVEHSAKMNGCSAGIGAAGECCAAEPDPRMVELASESIKEALGEEAWLPPLYTVGADDFNFYTKYRPIRATYLGLGCDLTPGLHSPKMAFQTDQILNGIKVMPVLLQKALAED